MTPVLSVRDLTTSFRVGDSWRAVVRNLSFDVHARETLAIVGESGSGKSVAALSVMRLLPSRLKIVISERTPVAFVEINSHIHLIDANGVVMDLPPAQTASYSFPVIVGMTDSEPLSTRAARMKIYLQFIKELDSGGAQYSKDISDVDLSDPDDVKATVTDPKGAILVHLGSEKFLERFKSYVAHVQQWRTDFPNLQSVDLRYEHQVIVNPDLASAQAKPAQESVAAAGTPEHKNLEKPAPKKSKKHK